MVGGNLVHSQLTSKADPHRKLYSIPCGEAILAQITPEYLNLSGAPPPLHPRAYFWFQFYVGVCCIYCVCFSLSLSRSV